MTTRVRPAVLALVLLCSGCSEGGASSGIEGELIDREVFVAVYVDLRIDTLDNPGRRVDDAERDSVLVRHGVTEEQLFQFVEVHGTDVEYMRDLWADVEARILALLSPEGDTAQNQE